ncbi:MAG: hypothetical protein ACXW20_21990, partial [Burkholderiales bacterium]
MSCSSRPRNVEKANNHLSWLHARLEPGLERAHEVATDLQRRLELGASNVAASSVMTSFGSTP